MGIVLGSRILRWVGGRLTGVRRVRHRHRGRLTVQVPEEPPGGASEDHEGGHEDGDPLPRAAARAGRRELGRPRGRRVHRMLRGRMVGVGPARRRVRMAGPWRERPAGGRLPGRMARVRGSAAVAGVGLGLRHHARGAGVGADAARRRHRPSGLRVAQPGELVHEGQRRGLPLLAVLGHPSHDRAHLVLRQLATSRELGDRRRLGREVLGGPLPRGPRIEGQAAGDHLVGHHRQRVDVATQIELLPAELLGAHIGRRAQDHPLLGQLGRLLVLRLAPLGDAEVEELHEVDLTSAGREEHVLGLEVPVDDPPLVGLGQRAADLDDQLVDHPRVQPPDALESLREVLPLDELHHDEERVVLEIAEIVELHGVRVVQLDDRLALPVEASHELRITAELGVEGLDGDVPSRRAHLLLGEIDLAHPALAEHLHDAVAPQEDPPDESVVVLGAAALLLEHRSALQAEASLVRVLVVAAFAGQRHRRFTIRRRLSEDASDVRGGSMYAGAERESARHGPLGPRV